MMKREYLDLTVEVVGGDIAAQEGIDAVVNAANSKLKPGGGVAGALHRAAGPGLAAECAPLAPIKPGEAVITGGHNLPNRHVIHCLGPVYEVDHPGDELLASCYRNALRLAEKNYLESIAFPSISTGVFGYPMDQAAEVAMRAIWRASPQLSSVNLVRFVLFDDQAREIHEEALKKVFDA